MNSTSTVFLEDFLKGCMRMNLRERTAAIFVKVIALILGCISVAFLFIVEKMGGVLSVATSLSAIAAGTTFGMFTLGMLIPWANSNGAIFGGIAGAITSGVVALGSQYVSAVGLVVPHKLPVSVELCEEAIGVAVNATTIDYPDESDIFPLFRLSYLWITPIGVTTVVIVGTIVSFLTGHTDLKLLDPDLLSPVVQFILPPESKKVSGTAIINTRRYNENIDEDQASQGKEMISTIVNLKESSTSTLSSSTYRW